MKTNRYKVSMVKKVLIVFLPLFAILCFSQHLSAQEIKKQAEAFRTGQAPEIDGVLDDAEWGNAIPATNFFQYDPYNGPPAKSNTELRFLYDDKALYIGQ